MVSILPEISRILSLISADCLSMVLNEALTESNSFLLSSNTLAHSCMLSLTLALLTETFSRISLIVPIPSRVFSDISLISLVTTANPFPASPTLATSIDALRARSFKDSLISTMNAPILFTSEILSLNSLRICSLCIRFSDTNSILRS